jgi:hypothetical protein
MRFIIPLVVALIAAPANCEDFDAAFGKLKELPTVSVSVSVFKYRLSIQPVATQGYIIQGRINGVSTKSTMLSFRAESPERVPGDAPAKFVAFKTTVGDGLVDLAADRQYVGSGRPEYPPDKPAAMFRCEVRHLVFVNNEVRLRIRFQDDAKRYLVRYEDGKGLKLSGLDPDALVQDEAHSVPDFVILSEVDDGITWYCNPLTTWATKGDKLLWSIDVPMEGQPTSLKIVGDVLFVTTTAGHSFYMRKDSGELAFYDKSIMAGVDPIDEVLALGRANMNIKNKRRSLARFIYAAVILNDRRAIPFLIECVENGDGIPVKTMAVAALEKFNGNPEVWKPKDPKTGSVNFQMAPMSRVFPTENRQAEIAKWRKVFAEELDK